MTGIPFEAREQVHLGIIGVGGRGTSLLQDLLAIEKVEVKAICDLVGEKVARAQKAVTEAGQPDPAGFSKGECDFKNLIQLELDIVYTATPWNWHVQGLALAWTFLLPLSADTVALPHSVGSRWITQRQDTFDISYEHGDRKWLNTHALCYQRLITDSYVQPIYMRQTFRVASLTCDFRLARRGAARLPITLLHSLAAHSS
jgi:hypothetical protein